MIGPEELKSIEEEVVEQTTEELHKRIEQLEHHLSLMKDMFKANMAAMTPLNNEELDVHITTVLNLPKKLFSLLEP